MLKLVSEHEHVCITVSSVLTCGSVTHHAAAIDQKMCFGVTQVLLCSLLFTYRFDEAVALFLLLLHQGRSKDLVISPTSASALVSRSHRFEHQAVTHICTMSFGASCSWMTWLWNCCSVCVVAAMCSFCWAGWKARLFSRCFRVTWLTFEKLPSAAAGEPLSQQLHVQGSRLSEAFAVCSV